MTNNVHLVIVILICSHLGRVSLVGGSRLDGYSISPGSVYHGKYTRDIYDAELMIPRHINEDGDFRTYELPKFYDRREINDRKKRSFGERVHLMLSFAGVDHHIELEPYHDFISPDMIIETRSIINSSSQLDDGSLNFKRPNDQQCHYRGTLRGDENSRAALSLCDGVAGYVHTNHGRYFIEPLYENEPDADGQQIHVVYKKLAPHENISRTNRPFCGTKDDWENVWTEKLAQLERAKDEEYSSIDEKREDIEKTSSPLSSTHSIHRYIEVAVIADRSFLDFHKDNNYEQYLLTVMNMVSDFYHDASVGNQIDVVVVRMIFLEKEKEEIDLHISTNGEKTLDSFAKWVEKLNPIDPEHPSHFDIGALVTRYDICAEGNNCNLLGLAYVAAACERKKAACINEDAGLLLGIVIAHEMGHNLGCSHDEKKISGCPPQDKDKSFFVMSPIVYIHTIRWSACSKKFITTFLDSGLGECLNNNPKNPSDKYKYPNMLPGAMYDADFQCKLAYPESKLCEGNVNCDDLWCNVGGNRCKSNGSPAADGTKCGENKWCIHKKCVEMGARDNAVDGGWSEWGKTGKCSRTCGGGVKFAERECNNPAPANGGKYCIGERKKFATCNTKPCDFSKPSFRAVQCTEYNKKKILPGGPHKWEPYLQNDLDSCALYCINQARTFMKLSPTTKDGTPCKSGTYHMCIGGTCRKVGCDWIIDSDAVEDVCGICKGGGTDCTKVDGDYTETGKSGYNKIVVVPKKSKNIRFYEKDEHENTLAVKLTKSKKYCLNANSKEQKSGNYPCAGSTIIYKHVKTNMEEISIKGPIKEDIELQYVFYAKTNPGVHYEYYIGTPDKSYSPKYSWEFIEWSDCDAKCSGGTKISEASCIEQRAGKVDEKFCKQNPRPSPKSQICNEAPCSAKWQVSQWSCCTGCEGKVGEMRRKIQCVRPGPHVGDDYIEVNLDECREKPPVQIKECSSNESCQKICQPKKKRDITNTMLVRFMPVEDQRIMIDELVDYGLARYMEKSQDLTESQKHGSVKESNEQSENFDRLAEDWIGQVLDKTEINARDADTNTTKFTTPVPGSIVIDSVPMSEIVVYEAPLTSNNSRSNIPDEKFQRQGDDAGGGSLNTHRKKVYRGDEAVRRLNELEPNHGVNYSLVSAASCLNARKTRRKRKSDRKAKIN